MSNKLKIGRVVSHAIEVRGKEVAEALVSVLFPDEVPEISSPADFIDALGAAFARIEGELEAADLAHAAELADDAGYRDQREEARAELIDLLLRTRGLISASHGSVVLAHTGLSQALPRGNQELVQHTRHIAGRLDEEVLGEPGDALVSLDLGALRKRLLAAAKVLDGSLSELERERREAQVTLERRDVASEAWTRAYLGVANTFVALSTMTGFDEIAARVKPTARRRAGRPEPLDEEAFELEDEASTSEVEAPLDATGE